MTNARIHALQALLADGEAVLITSDANRFYLTGFPSSAGQVWITRSRAVFLIDFRYFEKAKAVVEGCDVVLSSRARAEIRELAERDGVRRMFVEARFMSAAALEGFRDLLTGVDVPVDCRVDDALEQMRSVKTEYELSRIRAAQEMTDQTFSYILERIEAGRTERAVGLDMEFYMRRLGSEGVSFDFIVVSGKNSSLPHGVPTDKPIERGDFVTMDFGAVVDGYRSDMTRTVAVGAVSEEQRRVYDTVLAAQQAAIGVIRAGAVCQDIDRVARDLIDGAGYAGCFGHSLGHSVGIEIHENPSFSPRCDTVLQEGVVMTVEPGIYLENRFGVRIEDMVVATADGCIDLTVSRRDLIVL